MPNLVLASASPRRKKLLEEAGFEPEQCFTETIPNYETTSAEDYDRFLRGDLPPLFHGRGGWFIFGAKQ